MAFRRSREASLRIVDDPDSLRDLTESVRDRGFEEGALEPVSDRIDAALHLLEDRAEALESPPSGEPDPATLPPATAARHRLIVAAMHYLTRKDDAAPEASRAAGSGAAQRSERGERGGEVDDVVVVREVLGTAQDDLAPYLEEPGRSGPSDPSGPPVPGEPPTR